MMLWSSRHDRRASRLLFGTLLAAVVSSASTAAIMRPMDGFTSSMRAFGQWYTKANHLSPVPVAAAQACVLCGASDVLAQTMHGVPVDVAHVAAMATIATLFSGALVTVWLRHLEQTLPGTDERVVLLKTLADYICCAPIVNSAYIAFVPALTAAFSGASPETAVSLLDWTQEGFQQVMVLEACTFTPYNMLQFKLVQPDLRPLLCSCLSAGCALVYSGMTLGFS